MYVIKCLQQNDYFVGIEKNKDDTFEMYFSNLVDDAFVYDTYQDASTMCVFIHGLTEEDFEYQVLSYKKERNKA